MSDYIKASLLPAINTLAGWLAEDPVIPQGEIVIENGSPMKMKIADGFNPYSTLPYFTAFANLQSCLNNGNTAVPTLGNIGNFGLYNSPTGSDHTDMDHTGMAVFISGTKVVDLGNSGGIPLFKLDDGTSFNQQTAGLIQLSNGATYLTDVSLGIVAVKHIPSNKQAEIDVNLGTPSLRLQDSTPLSLSFARIISDSLSSNQTIKLGDESGINGLKDVVDLTPMDADFIIPIPNSGYYEFPFISSSRNLTLPDSPIGTVLKICVINASLSLWNIIGGVVVTPSSATISHFDNERCTTIECISPLTWRLISKV